MGEQEEIKATKTRGEHNEEVQKLEQDLQAKLRDINEDFEKEKASISEQRDITVANYENSKLVAIGSEERADARITFENDKKTADNNVLKNCLDKDLMLAKALKAGVKTLQNQTVHELEFTNIDNQATGQVLAQAFGQFNAIRTGIQGNNN